MNIEEFRNYCLQKPHATEDFTFDQETLVFKVAGKMFALTKIDTFESVNLKCQPEKALELREAYPEVQPGYHMNKKHWNTIDVRGSIQDSTLKSWIDHSFELVIQGFSKKRQKDLGF